MLNIPECVPKQLVDELEGYQKQIKILIRNYKVSVFTKFVDVMTYIIIMIIKSNYVPKYLPVIFMHMILKINLFLHCRF